MAVDYTLEDTWTQSGNNAVDGRFHDGAFLANGAGAASPLSSYRDGVLPSAYSSGSYLDLQVVPDSPTPSMAVRSNLGQSVISRSGQGTFVSTLRSTARIDLPASSTTNPRRDLVVAQVLDASIGDADTRTRIWSVTGTPAGSPVLPSLPTGAIPLAEVAVAANATQVISANITDLRKAAGIRGAVRLMLPGDSHADAGIYPGDARYCRTHQQVEVWKADGLWHGTCPIRLPRPTMVPNGNLGGATAHVMGTVSVSDPGWPYYITATASALVNTNPGSTTVMRDIYGQINVDDTVFNPSPSSRRLIRTHGGSDPVPLLLNADVTSPSSYTGAHTVTWLIYNDSVPSNFLAVADNEYWSFDVTLIPA